MKKKPGDDVLSKMESHVGTFIRGAPRTAVILGSGLGGFARTLNGSVSIPYGEIPFYPKSSVEGHSGELVAGNIGDRAVLVASGRFHMYEGYDVDTVTLPIRLFHRLGITDLIITNASGSVRKEVPPGSLMALKGHIDCTFRESADLPGINEDSRYHSPRLLKLAGAVAKREGVQLRTGVYAWTLGPSFETPAEVVLVRKLGGDAVGMSTVPEIRAAGDLGLEVLGISCLTNYAAGITSKPLTHEEVMEVTNDVSETFTRLMRGIVSEIGDS